MKRVCPVLLLVACTAPATDPPADTDPDTDTDTDADADADADVASGCASDRWDEADFATVIDVGPDVPAATPSDVEWETIAADTLVRIHLAGSPYRDKWAIDAAGTEADPIVVIGMCDPETGALPVVDADGAVTRDTLDFWNEDRGLVKIGGTSTGEDVVPAWVYVEDLELRGARSSHVYTGDAGDAGTYADNAAAFYVEEGVHVTVRGCTLTDSGNGVFASHDTEDLVVASNHLHGNGNVGSAYEHNAYTEALGITYEYNRFGALCDGCDGNNLKDRSAGTVIRYNWIEGGNRQLDLVDAGDARLRDHPSYRETFVYGNVLLEHDGADNSQLVHYGGDGGDPSAYRRGTLYFHHNTVVSERPGNTTLARLSDGDELLDVRNSVLYAAGTLGILGNGGTAELASNWISEGWRDAIEDTVTVRDAGDNLEGADPGFAQDYALAEGSACDGAAGAATDTLPPVTRQYVPHQQGAERPSAEDLGAFERE